MSCDNIFNLVLLLMVSINTVSYTILLEFKLLLITSDVMSFNPTFKFKLLLFVSINALSYTKLLKFKLLLPVSIGSLL